MNTYNKVTSRKMALFSMVVGLAATVGSGAMLLDQYFGEDQTGLIATDQPADSYQNAYSSIAAEDTLVISALGSPSPSYADPFYPYDIAPVTAIIRIDSIDGGFSYNEQTGHHMFPHTYGKMTVLDIVNGDIVAGQTLNFTRLGGIVTLDEYIEYLASVSESAKDKFLSELSPELSRYSHIEMSFDSNTKIEPGKTYIAFLDPKYDSDGNLLYYAIDGTGYGLREVRDYQIGARSSAGSSEITARNNITGEWDSLDSFIRR